MTNDNLEVTVQSLWDNKRSVRPSYSELPLVVGDVVIPIRVTYRHLSKPEKMLYPAVIIEGSDDGAILLESLDGIINFFELKSGIIGSIFSGKKDVKELLAKKLREAITACGAEVRVAGKLGGFSHALKLMLAFRDLAVKHGYEPSDMNTAFAFIDIKKN